MSNNEKDLTQEYLKNNSSYRLLWERVGMNP